MTEPRIAAYGTWTSPISAESLASSGHPVGGGAYAGDEVFLLFPNPNFVNIVIDFLFSFCTFTLSLG